MKIVHVIYALNMGGAENIMIDIMNEQVKLGHTLSLIVLNTGINASLLKRISPDINVITINRPVGSKNIFYFFKLYVELYRLSADITHCHNLSMGKVLRFYKIKSVLTVHDTIRDEKSGMLVKYYSDVVSITSFVQKSLYEKASQKSSVIHNGIYTEQLAIREKSKSKKFKILQISRLDYKKKGQDLLIKAIALLVDRIENISISCDFIGEGPSSKYLVDLASELNVNEYINFLGLKDRETVYENLCNYDLLVQPSRYEGFGLTIIEAMAAKVPVLVSNIEGPLEVIQNGEIGVCFENENVDDLANNIIDIMKNNSTDKVELAYKYAKENYDIKQTTYKYLDRYKMIIDSF